MANARELRGSRSCCAAIRRSIDDENLYAMALANQLKGAQTAYKPSRTIMGADGYRDTWHLRLIVRPRQLLAESLLDDLQLEALHDPLLKNLTSE